MNVKNWIRIVSLFSLITVMGILFSCKKEEQENTSSTLSLEQRYERAVKDAMIAEENEIYSHLTPINDNNRNLIWLGQDSNKRVLVVTWTKYNTSYPVDDTIYTWWGETWVTVVPEIQMFYQQHVIASNELILRAEQLLGLPKDKGNLYFAELWVKPNDLYRPSADNEITDSTAQIDYPSNIDSAYKVWFDNQIITSYYANSIHYPWTRLGYTYDWGNDFSEVGLSEYVIKKNASVIVKSISTNEIYLQTQKK